jgi:hypothetical protein
VPVWSALAALAWVWLYAQLQGWADLLTYQVLGLEQGSHLADAVDFFLYDVPKIFLLLVGMVDESIGGCRVRRADRCNSVRIVSSGATHTPSVPARLPGRR